MGRRSRPRGVDGTGGEGMRQQPQRGRLRGSQRTRLRGRQRSSSSRHGRRDLSRSSLNSLNPIPPKSPKPDIGESFLSRPRPRGWPPRYVYGLSGVAAVRFISVCHGFVSRSPPVHSNSAGVTVRAKRSKFDHRISRTRRDLARAPLSLGSRSVRIMALRPRIVTRTA